MTLGIKPTFPNTGFGYIEFDKSDSNPVKKVNQFREKPDYETAKSFLEAGNFLWNGGIFIWSVKAITEAFEKFQPQMNALFLLMKKNSLTKITLMQKIFPLIMP